MGFKELRNYPMDYVPESQKRKNEALEALYEPVLPVAQPISVSIPSRFHLPKFPKLPSFDRVSWLRFLNNLNLMSLLKRGGAALVLIWFGISTSGSYYGLPSGKFGGFLATVFYQWQAGTVMAFIGILLVYDCIRHY